MRILCVDDDELVLGVTSDLLHELGHDVALAGSGSSAIDKLRQSAIDILVTDIDLGDRIDGPMVARMAREVQPNLPIIYFSGHSPATDLIADGGQFLRKPCTLGALENAIARAVLASAHPETGVRSTRGLRGFYGSYH